MNFYTSTALVLSFVSGGIVTDGVWQLTAKTEVSCVLPSDIPVPDPNLQTLLKPTPIPLDGYRKY